MTVPSATREYTFGVGSTVPGSFLNHLEDLLYAYADSILPTSTGTQVLIQATAGDEAQVTIDREMWISATSLKTPVLGPAGPYEVYAAASTVPTSHSTAIEKFDLVVSTAPPPYDHVRHIGTLDWDGTEITGIFQDARKLNAAQLDAFIPSAAPAAEALPVASSNGKLDADWRPVFPGDAALGEVVDYWMPPGAPFFVPSAWALCNGAVVASGNHDFGPFPLQLPDLRDKFIVGANATAVIGAAGSPSSLALAAPGIGGVKTTHFQDSALSHAHNLPTHLHSALHNHSLPNHTHTHPESPAHHHTIPQDNWDRTTGASHHTTIAADNIPNDGHAIVLGNNDLGSTANTSVNITSNDTPNTDLVAGSVSSTSPTLESRPWFHSFARIMKVRN